VGFLGGGVVAACCAWTLTSVAFGPVFSLYFCLLDRAFLAMLPHTQYDLHVCKQSLTIYYSAAVCRSIASFRNRQPQSETSWNAAGEHLAIAQVLTVIIFLCMFGAIIWGKGHRYVPALIAAGLTIGVVFLLVMRSPAAVINVLNLGQLGHLSFWIPGNEHIETRGVNWQTIVFIGGMMAMVESMGEVGFFNWLCLSVARLVKYRVVPIFVSFMLISGFLAMFIDSITVLLFMTAIVIELARLLKLDPVPMIIAMIFAANTGGSATMSGDPPNIIIGTALGYTFTDFLVNTGPIAWIGMLTAVVFFYFSFRRSLSSARAAPNAGQYLQPRDAITNPVLFKLNVAIFGAVVVLLVTHAATGLSVAFIGVIAAVLTMLVAPRNALRIIRRVDWRTLLFFIGLFITVGGLEETGLLEWLATYIGDLSGGRTGRAIPIILWLSAFASAIVDNIPFAATMVPVISSIAQTTGIPLSTMAWTLALGTDIGGNATPIGASANVVGTAIAQREGHPITWRLYLRYALPATVLVIAVCWLYLVVRYA
jgi:Na+/H+ antiporter NhaD/arsenite permease-like protein